MESKKPQFVMVPMYVAQNPEISSNAVRVYIAIKSHLPNAFPSISRLVEMTGTSRCTVLRAIKELVKWRLLNKQKRPGKSNLYAVCTRPSRHTTKEFMEEIKKGPVLNLRPSSTKSETTTSTKFETLSISSETISTKLDGH